MMGPLIVVYFVNTTYALHIASVDLLFFHL